MLYFYIYLWLVDVVAQHILSREDNWNSWKNESCPNFIRKDDETKPKTVARYLCYKLFVVVKY